MANKAIRGITVEIGGDTTKLGKAIEDSEKHSRSLQTELRQVEKLLKFDPSSIELLSQKQQILTDNIEETSKTLKTLKEAQSQVEAQFKNGEIGADQYRAFQREILQVEKNLDSMKDELTSTEKAMSNLNQTKQDAVKETKEYKEALKDAEEAAADFNEKVGGMTDAVKTGAVALGTAAVAGAGYALNLSTDFDKAFNTLQTRTGATADELDSLNTAMENVYANNFGDSIEDVAESMATVKNNTKLTGDELQKTTEYALLMRDTFEFDVNESTRTAKMLMDTYGISAEQAYNLIAQGAQKGLDKNGDLLDTINEYSVHFSHLGIDAEGMFNMLVNGAENGTFSVDKLGDAVKEFSIRAIDGSDTTKAAFETLGFNADLLAADFAAGGDSASNALNNVTQALFNMDDPIQQNTVGVSLFGTMWEDLGADGVKALMDVTGECSTTSTALEDINNTKYDDIGSAIQGLGRTLQTELVEPIGDELKPVVEDAIGYVKQNAPQIKEVISQIVEKVGEFVNFVVNHGDMILSLVAGIGAAFITWNVVSVITSVISVVTSFIGLLKTGTTVMGALNAVMNMNPIGLIVTLIAGLVTAFITLWNTSEEFRNFWYGVWEAVKEITGIVVDAVVNFFTQTLPNAFNTVVTWFQDLPGKVQSALSTFSTTVQTIFTNVVNIVSNTAQTIYESLPNGFQLMVQNVQRIIQSMVTIFENIFNIIKTVVQTAIDVIKAIFTGDFSSIPGIVSGALEKIRGFCGNIFDAIVTIVVNWIAAVINYFRGWGETLVELFNNVRDKIATWWNNFTTTCKNAAKTVITAVINFFKELPGKIYNAIVGAIDRVRSWGSSLLSAAKTVATNVINAVINFFKQLPGKIYNAIVSAIDRVKTWGSNMLTAAKNAISKVVDGIINGFKALPGKMLEIGKNIVSGIANGITNAASAVYQKVKDLANSLVDKAKEALGINSPSKVFSDTVGVGIPEGVAVGVTDNSDIAKNAVTDMSNDLTTMSEGVTNSTTSHFTTWENTCRTSFDTLKTYLTEWWGNIEKMFTDTFSNVIYTVSQGLTNLPIKLQTAMTQLTTAITGSSESLINAVGEVTGKLTAKFSDVFTTLSGIVSGVYGDIISRTSNWIVEMIGIVNTGMTKIRDAIVEATKEYPKIMYDIGVLMMNQLIAGIESRIAALQAMLNQLQSMMSSVGSAISSYAAANAAKASSGGSSSSGSTTTNKSATNTSAAGTKTQNLPLDQIYNVKNPAMNPALRQQNLQNTFPNAAKTNSVESQLMSKLDSIEQSLKNTQIVLDTGVLVGETIDKIDASLADKQLLTARYV